MITLHGFGEKLGIKDASPLVLKIDVYLRMIGVDFKSDNSDKNLQKAPKGKLPYIDTGEEIIADSQFIIQYLNKNHSNLDSKLSTEQKSQSYLITKSLDENLYFCLVYSRWACEDTWPIIKKAFFGSLPLILRNLIPKLVRKQVLRNLKGQGISRHSHDEVLQITRQSFQALSDLLGDKKFFFGDKPSLLDATAYGILTSFIATNIDNAFNQSAQSFHNLVEYCQNIRNDYYSN